MQETGQQNVVSLEEAAKRLQMTAEQVVGLIEADILPAVEVNGTVWVPEDALAAHAHGSCDPGCEGRSFCRSDNQS